MSDNRHKACNVKRRFVLIDPSIKSLGGHHYEYAERVLRAAKERGMEAILLVHKECDASLVQSCDIRPVFSRTYWQNHHFYYETAYFKRPKQLWRYLKTKLPGWCSVSRLRERLKFTRLGLCVVRARDLSLLQIATRPCLIETVGAVPGSRACLAVAWVMLRVYRGIYSCVAAARVVCERTGLSRLLKLCMYIPAYLLGCIGVVPLLLRSVQKPADVFARECAAALGDIDFLERDIVFVPNATPAEMGGYAALVRKCAVVTSPEWAFLFRRPIFDGHPPRYAEQGEAARMHRLYFAALQRSVPGARVSFYTDTKELMQQYNRLGQYSFRTVPVPVDSTPVATARGGRAEFTIGYLGDARDEKGYGLLPQIVEDFKRSSACERSIRFLIQANFNTPGGEPESRIAKELLRQYPTTLVQLVEGPFASDRYAALLRQIDVMLVPYKPDSYIARSSGVLAESIAAGIPAVVPAGTWMGTVGDKLRREWLFTYLTKSLASGPSVSVFGGDYKLVGNKNINTEPFCRVVLICLHYEAKEEFFVRVAVTLNDEYGMPVRVVHECVKTINSEATVACDLEAAASFRFVAYPVDPQYVVGKCRVDLQAIRKLDEYPLHAAVVVYDHPTDIAARLRDVVSRYSTYKRLAVETRGSLEHIYSPMRLVDILCGEDVGAHKHMPSMDARNAPVNA